MRRSFIIGIILILLTACAPSPEQQATQTSTARTATAHAWTPTLTFTHTFTPSITSSPTDTLTFTSTLTPTITDTPTRTYTPTFDYPRVRVNVASLHCQYGPNKAYLHALDLHEGDTGVVWGRDVYSTWLYVMMDNLPIPCWVHKAYVDIEGDIMRMIVQQVNLPMANNLYAAPESVWTDRDENTNTVFVYWSEVWMTEDDDRGYFLDVWVCQGGYLVWMPASVPNQFITEYSFIDEPGCSLPSGGKLYTVEKHGYTYPVDIPWPPY
jgi:hypothetical protein